MSTHSMGHPGDLLSAYLDGELPPQLAVAVEAHVAGCAACRSELNELGGARHVLRSSPRLTAPSGFTSGLVVARRRSSRRGVALMLVAAGVAVVAGLALAPAHPDTSDRPSLALQSAARFEADLSHRPTTTAGVSTLRAQDTPATTATIPPASAPATGTPATGTDASGDRGRTFADRVGDAVGALLDAIGG